MGESFNTTKKDDSLFLLKCTEGYIEPHDEIHGPVDFNYFLIECCTGGRGAIIVNGTEFRIREGDCYVICPGDKITHVTTSESYRSEVYCFIKGMEMMRAVKRAGISGENPFAPREAYSPICAAIRRMILLENDRSLSADYKRLSEIYNIKAALVIGKNATESTNLILKAIGVIETSYNTELSVDDIAKRIGLERGYFSVLFREHTGITPHAYLNSIRIKRACTLMSETNLALADIALQVGLEMTSFSRMFKREMGISPSKYRQKRS
jgi:AraC-like DNA-binding protein